MHMNIVFTLTGPDRIGIVDDVTKLLLDLGSNVETSRMSRLGGEFAILMLVSMPSEQFARLDKDVAALSTQGYKVTASPTERSYAESHPGWLPYQVEVHGADHEGIIHEIAHSLSRRGISIESMDGGTTRAPISGTPLFSMTALIVVPPSLANQDWEGELNDVGHRLNVEIKISAAKKE